ncbi:MAG: FimV/HubP family polar landmark protein [Panacagrimonas sp.]
MLRRLIIAVACGLCFAWNPAQALGLGEIVLGSGLNQRFTAEIPFTSLSPEEAANVRARLAENADFERAGLERSAYLSSLKVDVIVSDSNPRVVLSSDEIAREPLLSLLIEVKTVGAGPRVLREYTVFLDPPGIGAAAPPPQARPMALPGGSAASAADEFYEAAGDGQSSAAAAPAAQADPGTYGPIRAGETLTTIARTLRPTGVTLDQTVLALFETNPDAFSNRDINSLRRDAMLAVPSPGRMQATSAEVAHARLEELRQSQFVQNTTARAMAPAIVSRPLPSAPTRPSTPTTAVAEDIDDTDAEVDAPAPADTAASTAALDSAPAAAPANTNAGESAALDAEADAPADAAASVDAPADAGAEDAAVSVGGEDLSTVAADSGTGESNLLWIVIGLLVLGGVAFLVIRAVRERRAQQEYAEASSASSELPLPRAGATGTIAKTSMSTRDELEALDRQFSDEERMASSDAVDAVGDAGRVEPLLSAAVEGLDETPDVASQDPLAEAEFHLAYGLHNEAETQLLKASKREPERTDLKIKLAETYFATGKAREFVSLTQDLKPGLSDSEWEKLAAMGRDLVPGDPGFQRPQARAVEPALSAVAPSVVPEAATDLVDQGLDFRLEELELPTADIGAQDAGAARKPDSNLLEFDLGEFDLGTPEPASKPAVVQAFDPEAFDLDTASSPAGDPMSGLALDDLEPLAIDLSASEDAGNGDDAGTKLDLARAYLEMGDMEMARSLLDEVATQGTEAQKRDAAVLRERLSA